MNLAFADTFFYLSLLSEDDPAHERCLAFLRRNLMIVTTEFVLLELGNACARAADHEDFLAIVDGLQASPRVRIIPLDSLLMKRGMDLMAARSDKDWSLTDCISFVVMQDERIQHALTGDRHFEQAGFVALLRET